MAEPFFQTRPNKKEKEKKREGEENKNDWD